MSLPRVQQLNENLINHIAAGEVVERPAAALKELLENSFDAGATNITIHLEKGGTQFLQVRDNGCGIHSEDLALAVSRHATSKIQRLEDLSAIITLGFRGEALAALAAVSQFSLTSKTAATDKAWQIDVKGGTLHPLKPAAHPLGTTVTVAELFYNTPARRRFMRSEKTEMMHIDDIIRRFALATHSTEIQVIHNQKNYCRFLPVHDPHDVLKRLEAVVGANFLKHALKIEFNATGLRLWGWVTQPASGATANRINYFYVNGRMIRDRLMMHAVKLAYTTAGFASNAFEYVLYLEVEPHVVDVNVHPTKQEVRFQESRLVHDFITKSILQAFSPSSLAGASLPNSRVPSLLEREGGAQRRVRGTQTNVSSFKYAVSKKMQVESPSIIQAYRELYQAQTNENSGTMHKDSLTQLSGKLGKLLQKHQYQLATAESCTAGGVAYAVTMTPGSSQWFDRGFVTYSNTAKQEMLGVNADMLMTHGAVSLPTVEAMAQGALQYSHAQVSIAVSGIAGPDGGTLEKPVGLVCFAWCSPNFNHSETRNFQGNREAIRAQSVSFVLEKLIAILEKI